MALPRVSLLPTQGTASSRTISSGTIMRRCLMAIRRANCCCDCRVSVLHTLLNDPADHRSTHQIGCWLLRTSRPFLVVVDLTG